MAHGDDAALDALLLLADTDLVILDDRHLKAALHKPSQFDIINIWARTIEPQFEHNAYTMIAKPFVNCVKT